MKIKWIDKKSVLSGKRKNFKYGDIIPSDFLTKSRISYLISVGKIKAVKDENLEEIPKVKHKLILTKKELKKKKEAYDIMNKMFGRT